MTSRAASYRPSLLAEAVSEYFQTSGNHKAESKDRALRSAGSLLIREILDHALTADKIKSISHNVFALDRLDADEDFCSVCESAMVFVSRTLGVPPPIILLQRSGSLSRPHLLSGYDGFGVLRMNRSYHDDRSEFEMLVHEFTHATVLSGNLFLDEGLATCIEILATGEVPDNFQLPSGAPPLKIIVNSDWSGDPHLQRLRSFGVSKPHEFAASTIWHWAKATHPEKPTQGLRKIVDLLSTSKVALNTFFAFDAIENTAPSAFDMADDRSGSFKSAGLSGPQETQIDDYFLTGKSKFQEVDTSEFQSLAKYTVSSKCALYLAKFFVTQYLEQTQKDPVTAALAHHFIVNAMQGNSAQDSEILRPYRLYVEAYRARSIIQRNYILGQMLSEFRSLISRWPGNPEVIVSVAKAQIFTEPGVRLADFNIADALKRLPTKTTIAPLVSWLLSQPAILAYDEDTQRA